MRIRSSRKSHPMLRGSRGSGIPADSNSRYGPADLSSLDLYRPQERAAGDLSPLVIYVFGGGWMIGNRYQFGSLLPGVHKLIEAGYAVAAIDYRLSRQAIFPAQIHDVKSDSPESLLVGGPIRERLDLVKAANPITYVPHRP